VHMVEQIASGQAHRSEVLNGSPPASRDDRARLLSANRACAIRRGVMLTTGTLAA
jgi:hypothetical protein